MCSVPAVGTTAAVGASSALADVYAAVVGQPAAIDLLRRSAPDPMPAYLFLGPRGSGRRAAAAAFAAEVISTGVTDPTAADRHRRLALAGRHPDVVVFERTGPYISVEQADEISRRSGMAPVETARQVLVLTDFELVREAAPKLLKTIEEPPPPTHFVVIATEIPPELVTIASRCVTVPFRRVPDDEVAAALVHEGSSPEEGAAIAAAVNGDLGRARLLAGDAEFGRRMRAWSGAVDRLDGTGSEVVALASELSAAIEAAGAPLRERQAAELEQLQADEELYGPRRGVSSRMAERHRRELRRHRTDELRMGLDALAARLRGDLVAGARRPSDTVAALAAIDASGEALLFNANERLLVQSVLLACSPEPGARS